MTASKVPESLFGDMDGFKDFEFSAPEGKPVPVVVRRLYDEINETIYHGKLPDPSGGLVVNMALDDNNISASFVRRDGLDRFWMEFSDKRKIFELPSSLVHEMAHLLNHLAQWRNIEAGGSLKGHDDGFERIAKAVGLPIKDLSSWPDPKNEEYLDWATGLLESVRSRTEAARRLLNGHDVETVLRLYETTTFSLRRTKQ